MGDSRLEPGAVFSQGLTKSSIESLTQRPCVVNRCDIGEDAIRRLRQESREGFKAQGNMGWINTRATTGRVRIQLQSHCSR